MMAQRSSPALLLAMLVALRACGGDGEPGTPPVPATDSVGLREIAAGLSFPLYVTAPAGR